MLDLALIEETIDDLINNGPTTFETCEHIAHLKITRDLIRDRMNVTRPGMSEIKRDKM